MESKKSGWYHLRGYYKWRYKSETGSVLSEILINGKTLAYTQTCVTSNDIYTGHGNAEATLYLEKDDVIEYKLNSLINGINVYAHFVVSRMFE